MTVTKEVLLSKLMSDDDQHRLFAARELYSVVTAADIQTLRLALNREPNRWIRAALNRALARIELSTSYPEAADETSIDLAQNLSEQMYARALEVTTRTLVHEIEPILGTLRLEAEKEVLAFPSSAVRRHLDRMDDLLEALHSLRRASSSPKIADFDLIGELSNSIAALGLNPAEVPLAAPNTLVARGDAKLVRIAFENGLRNAKEAVAAAAENAPKTNAIVVSAGSTDEDYWIAIIDHGKGLRANSLHAFDIGATTKEGHLGMGLATALQAMRSMDGTVALSPSTEHSTRFEIRWPKAKT